MSGAFSGPSILFCPGNRPDRFWKAKERADSIILDLEDSVGPTDKEEARAHVAAALPALGSNVIVRVNPTGTPWHEADVAAVRAAGGTTLMMPKVGGPSDLDRLTGFDVIVICETAAGVLNAPAIAAHPACVALLWGGEDLTADLGGRRSRSPVGDYYGVVTHARYWTLLAATAAGKLAIDAIYLDIEDLSGLRSEALAAADMGFAAKACIHPNNVSIIREQFAPSDEESRWARAVLEQAAAHEGDVFTFEGRMIDEPLLRQAARVIGNHDKSGR